MSCKAVDHQPRGLALAQRALLDRDRDSLVVAYPIHVPNLAPPGLRLHEPGVGDLAASLRVEGALRELRKHDAVPGPVAPLTVWIGFWAVGRRCL
jgi:hypothetical protein